MFEKSPDYTPVNPLSGTRINDERAHQGFFATNHGEVLEVFPRIVDGHGEVITPGLTSELDDEPEKAPNP